MALQFVNIHGETLPDPVARQKCAKSAPKPKPEEKSYHKGWRVVGIPPGELELARSEAQRLARTAIENGRAAKEFDEANWLQNHRGKPVRNKPYEIKSSADECAALAEKAGWLRVRVEEIKREVRKS